MVLIKDLTDENHTKEAWAGGKSAQDEASYSSLRRGLVEQRRALGADQY